MYSSEISQLHLLATAAALVLLGILLLRALPRLHTDLHTFACAGCDSLDLPSVSSSEARKAPPTGLRMHDLCFVVFMAYFRRIFVL